jgi:hypothetical protein
LIGFGGGPWGFDLYGGTVILRGPDGQLSPSEGDLPRGDEAWNERVVMARRRVAEDRAHGGEQGSAPA